MVYGIILIIYVINLLFVIHIIFQSRFRMPNFHYTLLLLIAFPFLTPIIQWFLFHAQRIKRSTNRLDSLSLTGTGKLFESGDKFFTDLMMEIDQAQQYILINLFIFNSDHIGKRIIRKLEEKQEEGVQVVIIYDLGARKKLKRSSLKTLKKLGGQVICFMPLFMNCRLNLNYRNHRKCIIIDHRIAYIGGFNIGDEYLGRNKKLGDWYDIELKITGCVKPLVRLIEKDLSRINVTLPNDIIKSIAEPTDGLPEDPEHESRFNIVISGLEKQINTSLTTFIKLIFDAKKEIQLMTPYLIMNDGLIDAILFQANQGIKISIILPAKNDHILVNNASRAMAQKLMHPNVYIYLYSPYRFMHAKVLLIDDSKLFVTSANLDNRSLYYNLELGAITEDKALIEWMTDQFVKQKNHSKLFTKEDVRLLDKLALLFATFL